MEERKKFRLADVVLSVICVVFVAEAAAPVASIGNSQYFWWVFMMIAFLLPYGMISSELGTTYTGDGGLYDWINKAFPRSKWGARASWYYWINFPLWMASLAVVCPERSRARQYHAPAPRYVRKSAQKSPSYPPGPRPKRRSCGSSRSTGRPR